MIFSKEIIMKKLLIFIPLACLIVQNNAMQSPALTDATGTAQQNCLLDWSKLDYLDYEGASLSLCCCGCGIACCCTPEIFPMAIDCAVETLVVVCPAPSIGCCIGTGCLGFGGIVSTLLYRNLIKKIKPHNAQPSHTQHMD